MRWSPNSSGHGDSDSSQLTGESVELTTVPLQLLALGVDNVGRRPFHEALVREHLFRTVDLTAQALDLRGCVAVRLDAFRLDDRLEDARLFLCERDVHAAAPEHLGRLLHALQRMRCL